MTLLALALRIGVSRRAGAGRRQLIIVCAVGLCVAGLALSVAAPAALQQRAEREAARQPLAAQQGEAGNAPTGARLLVQQIPGGTFMGRPLTVVRLAVLAEDPPLPPGLRRLPGAGESAVSPALARLLSSEQGYLLSGRLPGVVTGEIDDQGLVEADELVAYVHVPAADLQVLGAPTLGWGAATSSRPLTPALRETAALAGIAVMLPLIFLVRSSAALAREARERRARALFLIGVAGTRLRLVLLADCLVGGLLGVAAGLGLHQFVLSRLLPGSPPPGFRLGPDDLALSPWALLAIAVTVTALIGLVAREEQEAAERDIVPGSTQPLAGARVSSPSRGWYALLIVAVALLACSFYLRRDGLQGGPVSYLLPAGVLLLAIGFGPVAQRLAMTVAVAMSASARPGTSLGAARFVWNRRPAFRPLLALGVTCLLGAIVLPALPLFADARVTDAQAVAQGVEREALVGDGPASAVRASTPPGALRLDVALPDRADLSMPPVLVASCRELARVLVDGFGCSDNSASRLSVVTDPAQAAGRRDVVLLPPLLLPGGPTTLVQPEAAVDANPVITVVVMPVDSTDPVAVEQARDKLAAAGVLGARTVAERRQEALRDVTVYRYMLFAVLAFSIAAGAVGLASGIAAHVIERRRDQALLDKLGAPSRTSGRALTAEIVPAAAVSLSLAAALAIGAGVTYLGLADDRPLAGPARGYPFDLLAILLGTCIVLVGSVVGAGRLVLRHRSTD